MFPHYKKFPWFFLKDGWKDLGEMKTTYDYKKKRNTGNVHTFCGANVRIGSEGNKVFRYCPKCLDKEIYNP